MPKIKICGLCRTEDIDYVNATMPDYVGFVFADSRRRVTANTAKIMRQSLDENIKPVGVFVNADIEQITFLYSEKIIDTAQLHGSEDEAYINALKSVCDIPVVKVISVKTAEDIILDESIPADYLLLDNGAGGTGQTFDWALIPEINKPFFLAGGVNLENIDEAIKVKPYCIDVSSGAETDGIKDKDKIIRLVDKVRKSHYIR